jgi:hypothetical protein
MEKIAESRLMFYLTKMNLKEKSNESKRLARPFVLLLGVSPDAVFFLDFLTSHGVQEMGEKAALDNLKKP